MGTWQDPDLGRPMAAPLERCAELLGADSYQPIIETQLRLQY